MSVGKRLYFGEFGDYASAGDQPAHRVEGDLTVEAWVWLEPTELSPMRGGIVTKLYTDGGSAKHGGYGLLRADNSYLLFYVAGNSLNLAQAPCLVTGRWQHVAGVYDGATLALYVDGELRAKTSVLANSSPPQYQPNTELFVGRHKYGPDNPFTHGIGAKICEARVWSCARTKDEIAQAMAVRLSGSEANLVGYWPLDDVVRGEDLCGTAPLQLFGAAWSETPLPFVAAPGSDLGKPKGWGSTSAILSAALETLNRSSAIGLLEQLIGVLHTQDATHTGTIAEAKIELAQLLSTVVSELTVTTTSLAQQISDYREDIDTLEASINAQIIQVPNDLDTEVTARLNAEKPSMNDSTTQALIPQVEGVFDQVIEDKNLPGLSDDVAALQQRIEDTATLADSLSEEELERVGAVIEEAIMGMDLAPVIENALISVNGKLVRLRVLAQKLLATPAVENIEISYDGDNISSAAFVLADGTSATFTAQRIDLPNLNVHYRLRSANLNGFPAEFELRFARTTRLRRLGDSDVVFEEYEPTYQSRVLYSIAVP